MLTLLAQIDEEIGFDVSELIVDSDYLKITVREQNVQLFIVVGVDENLVFQPKTKKEISVRACCCALVMVIVHSDFGVTQRAENRVVSRVRSAQHISPGEGTHWREVFLHGVAVCKVRSHTPHISSLLTPCAQ